MIQPYMKVHEEIWSHYRNEISNGLILVACVLVLVFARWLTIG